MGHEQSDRLLHLSEVDSDLVSLRGSQLFFRRRSVSDLGEVVGRVVLQIVGLDPWLLKLVREECGAAFELEHLEAAHLTDLLAHQELLQQLPVFIDESTSGHGCLQRLERLILLGRTHFLRPRGDHNALLNQSLFVVHFEVLVDLLVVNESEIGLLLHELRSYTVNRIDRTALEFVEVARYYFRSLHRVR